MQRKPFPSETQERFIVRFPDGMRDRISAVAKAGHRSMNAEIVARIRRSFELDEAGDTVQAGPDLDVAELKKEIARLCRMLQEHKDAAAGLFEAHKEEMVTEALRRLRSEAGEAAAPPKATGAAQARRTPRKA